MPCEYFRYINLLEVYDQLEGFSFYTGPDLSNIQYQFGESLSWCFEELSYAAFTECEEDAWKVFPAAEVADAVGSLIKTDLERIAKVAEISIPSRRTSGRTAIGKLTILSIHASFGDFDYWQKTSLMVYQYDLLCWLYSKNKIEEAFEVYELILKNRGDLAADFALSVASAKQSELARERARKRHALTNKIKLDLLAEWGRTSKEYKSRADFCRIVAQREGLLYRTVYDWIARHDRDSA
jgi:hypothetical protein